MALEKPFPIQKSDISFGSDPVFRLLDDIFGEGVVGAADLAVAQKAAGANMSVDVAAGSAYVDFDSGDGGTRRVRLPVLSNSGTPGAPNTTDGWISTFTTADPTNPRIDRVCLRVRDSNIDASGAYASEFVVVAGTPTGGATLSNLTGAAAVPSNAILLANVLVAAAATTIVTAQIDTTVRSRARVGGGLALGGGGAYRKTTAKDVTNTVTETDLLNGEITVGAGAMGLTGMLRATLWGDVLNNSGGAVTPTLKVKLGATTIYNDIVASIATGAGRRGFRLDLLLLNLGVSNSQSGSIQLHLGPTASAPTTGVTAINTVGSLATGDLTSAVDMAAAQVLAVTITWGSAVATLSWNLRGALVELL